MVAFVPNFGVDRDVGIRLLGCVLHVPTVDDAGHVRAVLRLHGAAFAGTVLAYGVHRVLLVPVVHEEDLLIHQGGISLRTGPDWFEKAPAEVSLELFDAA